MGGGQASATTLAACNRRSSVATLLMRMGLRDGPALDEVSVGATRTPSSSHTVPRTTCFAQSCKHAGLGLHLEEGRCDRHMLMDKCSEGARGVMRLSSQGRSWPTLGVFRSEVHHQVQLSGASLVVAFAVSLVAGTHLPATSTCRMSGRVRTRGGGTKSKAIQRSTRAVNSDDQFGRPTWDWNGISLLWEAHALGLGVCRGRGSQNQRELPRILVSGGQPCRPCLAVRRSHLCVAAGRPEEELPQIDRVDCQR